MGKGSGSYSLEVEVLEGEVDLHDSGGLHPGPEDVLLGRLVVLGAEPLKVVQEAGKKKKWRIS